jgi:RNA-splicing ligase RtcB
VSVVEATVRTPARPGGPIVKAWDHGVPMEPGVWKQVDNLAAVPGVERIAIMPDAHIGNGVCVGSAILTRDIVIPAAVGVDIGCGMIAAPLGVRRSDVADLKRVRKQIEQRVPVGRTNRGQKGDRGAWGTPPKDVLEVWHSILAHGYLALVSRHKELEHPAVINQLGTLGTGNHFLEVCIELDTNAQEDPPLWLMLHSGSRGVGNRIGQSFTRRARTETEHHGTRLPDPELGFFSKGSVLFDDYLQAARWAQEYAWQNRMLMFRRALDGIAAALGYRVEYDEPHHVHCFAGETTVLTRGGTRPIKELAGGVHELLTEGGKWVLAPVRAFGRQPLMKVTVSRNGVRKVLHATPGHRWLLRAFGSTGNAYIRRRTEATTAELLPGDRLAYSFPGVPEGRALETQAVARGFLFGDGYVNVMGPAKAQFCGAKDEALLPFLSGTRAPRRYVDRTIITGLPREWKTQFPQADAGPGYLYAWLAGYFAADGDVDKTGRPTLASARRLNLETVRTLAAEAGVGTYGVRTRIRSGFGHEPTPLHMVGLMRGDLSPEFFVLTHHRERFAAGQSAVERRGWTVVSVEPTERVEEVYCAVVQGTHSFTLEDNILTGNCHHNYVATEEHFGKPGLLTRKGAVNAARGVMGIIPGSMGAKSYITRGKGNPEALHTSSHGAGRVMSRGAARRSITLEQHLAALAGVECRTDADVIDESPACYKDIDAVMAAQADLTEPVVALKQIIVVKG